MANAPCARLTKFIRPRVTDRPQASTNSSMPYATPSNRMVNMRPPARSSGVVGWAKSRDGNHRRGQPRVRDFAHAADDTITRGCPPYQLLLRRFDRILHVLVCRELDVVELAVLLLDLADIDVLDDVAGVRIDRDRTARALPLQALHGGDQLVAVGVAVGLLQRLVDRGHAVVAADRSG